MPYLPILWSSHSRGFTVPLHLGRERSGVTISDGKLFLWLAKSWHRHKHSISWNNHLIISYLGFFISERGLVTDNGEEAVTAETNISNSVFWREVNGRVLSSNKTLMFPVFLHKDDLINLFSYWESVYGNIKLCLLLRPVFFHLASNACFILAH